MERAEKRARRIISKRLGLGSDDYLLEPMAEGASSKRFFRIIFTRAGAVSAVLMMLDRRFRTEKSDYFQVCELMRKLNIPVPAIYESFGGDGAMLLEDLGGTTLFELAPDLEGDEDALEEYYRQAVDSLITLQTRAGRYADGVAAFSRAFDVRKLRWELGFTVRHFVSSFAGYSLNGSEKRSLDDFFADICRRLAALPRVLCHRDYHSQNLVPRRGLLYITDFQDARLGPHVYDLVSLLRDSYIDLGESLRSRLLVYYLERHPDFSQRDGNSIGLQFDLMSFQRHLKHLGTFGHQAVNGRPDFLRFVPLTLRYLEENFDRFLEYREAAAVFAEIFAAAREKLPAGEGS